MFFNSSPQNDEADFSNTFVKSPATFLRTRMKCFRRNAHIPMKTQSSFASHPATLPGWIFRNEIHPAETATVDLADRLNLRVQRQFPDHTSLRISQRMNDNEGTRINSLRRSFDSANLQTSYHAKQDVLLLVSHSAAPFVNRDPSFQLTKNNLPDFLAAF
jgi:hypothetical protein